MIINPKRRFHTKWRFHNVKGAPKGRCAHLYRKFTWSTGRKVAGRCDHQSKMTAPRKMTVPQKRNARGRSILPSSIPLQRAPRGRCEHQSKMKDPQIRNARGRSVPPTPRRPAVSLAPEEKKPERKKWAGRRDHQSVSGSHRGAM